MRDVHAALAGHQELAANRGHGVIEIDRQAGKRRQHLGGHQPGRAAADDGDTCVHG